MNIGGLQKFSLLDYPGQISAIVFTQGCNFRCPFCYNPMLVTQPADEVHNTEVSREIKSKKSYSLSARTGTRITEDDFFVFLRSRQGKLDAIVITGGEPTIQPDLIEFARKIKDLNYKIKLDTNGTNPKMLKELLDNELVDYIAVDIKAAPDKYKKAVQADINFEKIKKSTIIIKEGSIPYEFRTTIVPGMHEPKDIENIGKIIKGAQKWYLQEFKSETDLIDNSLKKIKPYSGSAINKMKKIIAIYANISKIR